MPDKAPDHKAFVIMPFAAEFDDVLSVIKSAVETVDAGLTVVRLDDLRYAGKISNDLVTAIETAAICIADVSDSNPNVMWEVGFATALRKPVVVINHKASRLPFDLVDVRAVMYDRESLTKSLRDPLAAALKQTLEKYSVTSTVLPTLSVAKRRRRSIALTGSMSGIPERTRERLARIVDPYVGQGIEWYVGSFGVVDELAVQLLLDRGEHLIHVLGYSSYDLSGRMLELLHSNDQVDFVDATAEQAPFVPGAPSSRDVLMMARCDLIIVGWDGVSRGSSKLLDWLITQRKDHAVFFI